MVYSSPKQHEMRTGNTFSKNVPCIHKTGSVKGMISQGFWSKDHDIVRSGAWIYNQSLGNKR